jgi:hypothetical protein
MARDDKKEEQGIDTTGMTDEEKRAASRERVKQGTSSHQVKSDMEKEVNKRFAGGKTWKEIVKEGKQQKEEKQR